MLPDIDPAALRRLLALYPVHALKEKWSEHKRKDKILDWVVANAPRGDIEDFLDQFFSCCKQHVYSYSHQQDISDLPAFRIKDATRIVDVDSEGSRKLLYLGKMEYHVIFTDPLKEDKIVFLWPIRLEFTGDQLLIRFVTMEKDASSYFDEASKTISRNPTEPELVAHLESALALTALDLNRGIKTLWEADRFDGIYTKFLKAKSTSTESMKPGFGYKKDYPETYEELKNAPLGPGVFRMAKDKEQEDQDGQDYEYSFDRFTADPTRGTITFPTYSKNQGDTDRFVAEIIEHN